MNPRFAHLLMRFYPRRWRQRYGTEFEELLQSGRGDVRTLVDVVWSSLREHFFPSSAQTASRELGSLWFRSWCVRSPWVFYSVAPLFALAAAYFVACFILWSGWRMFLPEMNTPFVRIDGFAIFYFGVGRFLYYSAPILVGWGIGLLATRQRVRVVWPMLGSILIALVGGTAQIHADRTEVPGGLGHIRMDFTLGGSAQSVCSGLLHSLVILSLATLPGIVWRLQKNRSSAL
jgi:hypothetical protein